MVRMSTLEATTSEAEVGFLAALAAGLPAHEFWSERLVVGVSGGADSVALLVGLHSLAAGQGVPPKLLVAHAKHDLREAAAADAAFVVNLAAELGVSCMVRDVRVREPDDVRGEGIEGRARRLRYEFLTAVARDEGARFVVVAHTADDQAETILHRMLRGTGLMGLAGMASARELSDGVALVRPLLAVPRGVVRRYLESRGQVWMRPTSMSAMRGIFCGTRFSAGASQARIRRPQRRSRGSGVRPRLWPARYEVRPNTSSRRIRIVTPTARPFSRRRNWQGSIGICLRRFLSRCGTARDGPGAT